MCDWPHLEDVAGLVSNPHLENAREAAQETLGVKGRGAVHALGSGVAINVVRREKLLHDNKERSIG